MQKWAELVITHSKKETVGICNKFSYFFWPPTWARSAKYAPSHVEKINRMQRRDLARSTCAYISVSKGAMNTLTSTPPTDLLALEKWKVFELRRRLKLNTKEANDRIQHRIIDRWKVHLEEATTGQWTREIIFDLDRWYWRPFGFMNYYLTQVFTGHGCFRRYLHKIKKELTCRWHCGADVNDARHTLFACPSWEKSRTILEWDMDSTLDELNLVRPMLSNNESWHTVSNLIGNININERGRRKKKRIFWRPYSCVAWLALLSH